MTPEEINKKAYEKYPVKTGLWFDSHGSPEEIDLNEESRNAYIEAYKEISALPTIKGWVARNSEIHGGHLKFFATRPHRKKENADEYINYIWLSSDFKGSILLPKDFFPDLRWKDEPIEVELPIIRK
jgi:hypothetical protein